MKRLKNLFPFLLLMAVMISCNNYGTKLEFDGTEVYYTENVTKDEAEKLGKFLQDQKFTDGSKKSVQFDKKGDLYLFRMVAKDDFELDAEKETLFKTFITLISTQVLDGADVEIQLCDNKFKTIDVVKK